MARCHSQYMIKTASKRVKVFEIQVQMAAISAVIL
jgi:hypothetical protein